MAKDKADKTDKAEKADKRYGNLMQQKRTYDDLENKVHFIPTGSLIFDIFLGGGYCPGLARFVAEPEHGKTLQALNWAKHWLEYWGEKGEVHYFDVEGRLTPKKLRLSGITNVKGFKERFNSYRYNVFDDISKFLYDITMDNPEGKHYFIVFDSLDMLITNADMDKTFGEAEKVGAAQVMSTLLMKKVGVYMADQGHHLHILSQIRANINTSNPNSPKTKMSGANALRHSADIIGEIQKNFGGQDGMFIYENPNGATVKDKGNIIGHYCTIKFAKTMNEKTGQTIRIPIKRGSGVWREREVVDLALAFGQIRKKGAWFQLKDEKEGWANDDWITRINADVTAVKQARYVEDELNKAIAEAEEKKETLGKAKIKELTQTFTEAAKSIKFEIETAWQGYNNLFSYIEKNQDVVAWMDKEFRTHLLSDSVAIEVGEEDTSE